MVSAPIEFLIQFSFIYIYYAADINVQRNHFTWVKLQFWKPKLTHQYSAPSNSSFPWSSSTPSVMDPCLLNILTLKQSSTCPLLYNFSSNIDKKNHVRLMLQWKQKTKYSSLIGICQTMQMHIMSFFKVHAFQSKHRRVVVKSNTNLFFLDKQKKLN